MAVVFRLSSNDGDGAMEFNVLRGARKRDRRPRSFPGEGEGIGWSSEARRCHPVVAVLLDSLQNKIGEMVREMRRVRRGRLGEGEVPVVTDGGEFGRRSLLSCGGSARDSVGLSGFPREREKGGEGGASRLYIGAINLKNKLGFGSG
jgi:hypothetical protein